MQDENNNTEDTNDNDATGTDVEANAAAMDAAEAENGPMTDVTDGTEPDLEPGQDIPEETESQSDECDMSKGNDGDIIEEYADTKIAILNSIEATDKEHRVTLSFVDKPGKVVMVCDNSDLGFFTRNAVFGIDITAIRQREDSSDETEAG